MAYLSVLGFYFPQGLLTAVLQRHSRATKVPIDHLVFEHHILDKEESDIGRAPDIGVYISGLYMTGASWSIEQGTIVDSTPGQLCSPVPIVWFKPIEIHPSSTPSSSSTSINIEEIPPSRSYQCPLYITSARGGTMLTSGTSSNFVAAVDIPYNPLDGDKWTLRGAALLCQPSYY